MRKRRQDIQDPLFLEFLEDLKKNGLSSSEPTNGGVRIATFFDAVREMGDNFQPRAGVIARLKKA